MQAVAAVVLAVVSIGLLWYAWREISAMPRETSSGLQESLRPRRTGRSGSSEDGEPGPSDRDAAPASGDLDEPSAEVPAGPEAPPSGPEPVDDPDGGRLAGPSPAEPELVGDAEPAMPRREAEETEPLGSEAPGPGVGEELPETPAPGPESGEEPAAGTSDGAEDEMGLPSYRPPGDREERAERRPPGTGTDEASPAEDAETGSPSDVGGSPEREPAEAGSEPEEEPPAGPSLEDGAAAEAEPEIEADAGANREAAPTDESAAERDGGDEPSGREEEDSGPTGPAATFATGVGSAGVQAPGPDETTSEETAVEEGAEETAREGTTPPPEDEAPEPEAEPIGGADAVEAGVDFELIPAEEGSGRGYRVRRGPAGDPIPWDSLPLAEGLLAFEVAEVERHLDVAQLAEFSPGESIRLAPEADSSDGGGSGEGGSAPSPPRIGVYDGSGEYRVGYVPRNRSELVAELVAADPGYRGRVLWETTRQGQVVGLRVLITASDAAVRLP